MEKDFAQTNVQCVSHVSHRRRTIISWIVLTLCLGIWGLYSLYQHDHNIHITAITGLSHQHDVIWTWAEIHAPAMTSNTALPPLHRLDETRTLRNITHQGFDLEINTGSKHPVSHWKISLNESHGADHTRTPQQETEYSDDPTRYQITHTIPTPSSCANCHHHKAISYSVHQQGENLHEMTEIIILLASYLTLFGAGITISTINHNTLARISHTRHLFEKKLQAQYESQRAVANILKVAISNLSTSSKLQTVLDILTEISWFKEKATGIIFTASNETLVMSAQKGVSQQTMKSCSQVNFGECLCGSAAIATRVQLRQHTDNHLSCSEEPHSHYCVPIIHDNKLLGLLNMYLEHSHQENADEIEFLTSVGHSLGNMMHKSHMEEKLVYDAWHDQLTGIANRAQLAARVRQRILKSQGDNNNRFALLFLDLDRFKYINDSLGHYIGDRILIETANRLQRTLRDCDTIARLGGDEFAILIENLDAPESIYTTTSRIHRAIEENIHIDSYNLHTTCSIGVACYNKHYHSFEQLLRDADIAMYSAKSSDSDKTVLFNQHMHKSALNILTIESDLRYACTHGELITYYQPIYSRSHNRFIGAEALIRWKKGDITIPPAEFISVAEDSGLITLLGEYVLHSACRVISHLTSASVSDDFYISVNVSAKQMFDRKLVSTIDEIMKQHATPAKHLRLEITESLFADNAPLVASNLSKIKQRGIKLMIDDFGTGYSSLSFLHNHPFDCVKIDRSFIARLSDSANQQRAQKLVCTILGLAGNLDMSVIAEGVEEVSQLQFLQQNGCDLIQGYLFSEPIDAEKFIHTMNAQVTPPALV